MKPLKLTMVAFGPFADKQEIDFTMLGDNPLFLINGPTGAGKSTILDAICFALYGHTTGADREPGQMRCDHSPLDVNCEVSLDFMLGNKHYRIWRSPIQERPKSRGEGMTTKPAEAKLWLLDGSTQGVLIVSKGVAQANTEIAALMGIGLEQFRQVMVLPQGKFREFLMADSKARESIFSQLFETHIYKRIENKLKQLAGEIKHAVDHQHSKIQGILEGANLATREELTVELAQTEKMLSGAKTDRNTAQLALQKAQTHKDNSTWLSAQFEELSAKQKMLLSLVDNKENIEHDKKRLAKARKAQAIQHLYTIYQGCAETLTSVNQQLNDSHNTYLQAQQARLQALAALELAAKEAQQTESLKSQQSELTRFLSQLDDLAAANKAYEQAQLLAKKNTQALAIKKQETLTLQQERQAKEDAIAQYIQDLEALVPLQQLAEKLTEKVEERRQLDELVDIIGKSKQQQSRAEDELAQKSALLDEATKLSLHTELKWHQGQAASLAIQLRDDSPCPVCGSKEHPQPANAANNSKVVTKEEVDIARSKQSLAQQHMQNANALLTAAQHKVETYRTQQMQNAQRLGEYASMPFATLIDKQKAIQADINKLVAIQHAKNTDEQRIVSIKALQAKSTEALQTLEEEVLCSNNTMISAQSRREQLQAQIPNEYQDAEKLTATLSTLNQKIARLSQQLMTSQSKSNQAQSAFDTASATKAALCKQQREQQQLTQDAQKQWQNALDASEFVSVDAFLQQQLDAQAQSDLQHSIDSFQTKLSNLQAIIEQLLTNVEGKQAPDTQAIEQALLAQRNTFDLKDKIWRELDARAQHLHKTHEKLLKADEDNKALNDEYEVIGTLSEVASGNTGNKISLQRFVLSVLLDDVLIQASTRLHIMSKGRYQLMRKEDRARGNKASGLELEVLDGDTGKLRAVATLSGGESFMAALSLALGLSEVVQSYAGGIRLDTLFIDEGFGSLDSDALDAAINVLLDLQANGRMIGIISHVSELKEQMAKRIDVYTSKIGSRIETIT